MNPSAFTLKLPVLQTPKFWTKMSGRTHKKTTQECCYKLLFLFHTGGVGPSLHELRRMKGPTVHPTKSQISLDHRWNESDTGTSKVPPVFGETPTAMQLCPLQNPHALPCLESGPPHWEDGDQPTELRRCRWKLMRKLRNLTNLRCLSQHAWLWGTTQGRSTHTICYHVLQLATRVSDPHPNTLRLPTANYSNPRRLIQTWEDANDATKFWYFVTAALNTELGSQVLLEIHSLRHSLCN